MTLNSTEDPFLELLGGELTPFIDITPRSTLTQSSITC